RVSPGTGEPNTERNDGCSAISKEKKPLLDILFWALRQRRPEDRPRRIYSRLLDSNSRSGGSLPAPRESRKLEKRATSQATRRALVPTGCGYCHRTVPVSKRVTGTDRMYSALPERRPKWNRR